MVELGGFIFDAQGLAERGPAGARREWRGLAGVEVLPPLWATDPGWETAFIFSGSPPVFVCGKAVAELATALRFARAAAPGWVLFSPRAQLLLEWDPAKHDPAPSLAGVRQRRAQRRTHAAWSMAKDLRMDPADLAALRLEEVALVEESGRCPAGVLEAFELELRKAPRDAATFAAVTRIYLAIDHEFAASYGPRALQKEYDRPAVTAAYARWLTRHERAAEAEELLRGAIARGGEPATLQPLTAQQVALRHHVTHPRQGRRIARWTLRVAGIAAAVALVGWVSYLGWTGIRRLTAARRRAVVPTYSQNFPPPPTTSTTPRKPSTVALTPPHPDAFKDLPRTGEPICLFSPPPVYPLALRASSVEGQVLVDFIVDDRGIPWNVYAIRSTDKRFEDAATTAVQGWKFRPGTKDGQRVSTHLQVPIVFTLSDEPAPGAAKK